MMTACVDLTPGFQPATVPSSVTQMNSAGLPGARRKSVLLPLKTMPVGVPLPDWPPGAGMVTTSVGIVTGLVEALTSVEVPLALLEIHHGEVAECTSPQAFLRLGSVACAPPVFDTRSV